MPRHNQATGEYVRTGYFEEVKEEDTCKICGEKKVMKKVEGLVCVNKDCLDYYML